MQKVILFCLTFLNFIWNGMQCHFLFFFEKEGYGDERIVGGQLANDNQFPYQVAIINYFGRDNLQDFLCSGTLITSEWVRLISFNFST